MRWQKKGLIFAPSPAHPFCTTRAMCPTPYLIAPDRLRLYTAFCDNQRIARPGYVDVNPDNPSEILELAQQPLMEIGADGRFDDNGLAMTAIVPYGDALYGYYFAFQQGVKLPFYMFTGLAISRDGGKSFTRAQQVPVLDRTDAEPILRSGTFVLFDATVNLFKAWYAAGDRFIEVNGKRVHTYVLKYAESTNGIDWPKEGTTVLRHANDDEYGFGRPYVVQHTASDYTLYYSLRTASKGYRLGYATSTDGIHWTRRDAEMGIDVSPEGWDTEMQCYSAVYTVRNKTYLFYNGNGLGNTGFGYAELQCA